MNWFNFKGKHNNILNPCNLLLCDRPIHCGENVYFLDTFFYQSRKHHFENGTILQFSLLIYFRIGFSFIDNNKFSQTSDTENVCFHLRDKNTPRISNSRKNCILRFALAAIFPFSDWKYFPIFFVAWQTNDNFIYFQLKFNNDNERDTNRVKLTGS